MKKEIIADDIDIGYRLLDKGYKVVTADIPYYPIGLATSPKSLFVQKQRTAVALMRSRVNYQKFYVHIFGYYITHFYRYSIKDHIAFMYWCLIYAFSFLSAKTKQSESTNSLWIKYQRNVRL